MPAIPLRPGRKTLYPDTSALVYAFKGARHDAAPGDRAILAAIRQVAAEANLCLSVPHILELGRGDARWARQDARVLEELDVVWCLRQDRAEQLEIRQVLRGLVLGVESRPTLPWAHNFEAQFSDFRPADAEVFRKIGGAGEFIAQCSESAEVKAMLEKMAAFGRRAAQRFFLDRRQADGEKLSNEDRARVLREKTKGYVTELALAQHKFLVREDGAYRIHRKGRMRLPNFDELEVRLPLPSEAPMLLPTFFAFREVAIRHAAHVAGKESLESNFFKDRDGDPFDWQHLVGAAYCDGFTCDGLVGKNLAGVREQLGLSPPLVLQGDKEVFARQLLQSVR